MKIPNNTLSWLEFITAYSKLTPEQSRIIGHLIIRDIALIINLMEEWKVIKK